MIDPCSSIQLLLELSTSLDTALISYTKKVLKNNVITGSAL